MSALGRFWECPHKNPLAGLISETCLPIGHNQLAAFRGGLIEFLYAWCQLDPLWPKKLVVLEEGSHCIDQKQECLVEIQFQCHVTCTISTEVSSSFSGC